MRSWIVTLGTVALLAGCAAMAEEIDGGQCSCPPGPPGPQGPQGPAGPQGPKGEPGKDAGASGEATSKSGSRLTYLGKTLRGSDGSQFLQGGHWHDEELGVDCYIRTGSDGRTRCVPLGTAADAFTDEDCTSPAVLISGSDECGWPSPRVATISERLTCGDYATSYHFVGAEVGAAFQRAYDGTCVPVEMDGRRAFRLGSEIPLSSLVEFKE